MEPSSVSHWHLLYCKPHREPLVSQQLAQRQLPIFFPLLQLDRGYGRGIRLEPFFPHYLFVEVDLASERAHDLQWLPGVRSIVAFDDRPAVVPTEVIEILRQRLERYTHRVLRKTEWLFQPGDPILITHGPLTGCEALFQRGLNGGQRAQVLIRMLGAWNRTIVDVDLLKRLQPSAGAPLLS